MPNATAMLRRARGSAHRRPAAFTLVELLVVVGIVAMLAAITLPAIFGARVSAKNAAIRAEIDMMHMAMMNYRNEYGSFPPCASGTTSSSPAGRHIARIFPRCANPGFELGTIPLTPDIALVSWLRGYTNDPTLPVTGILTGGPRRELYDFDESRTTGTANLQYAIKDKPGSPFIYIDSGTYGAMSSPTTFTVGSNTFAAQVQTLSSGSQFFNPDTFQILSPGLDATWGTDDDVSNFWPTTRGAYNASLR